MQVRHRHVELVALGVLDAQELGFLAADIKRFQPGVAAHAVIFMHDGRADRNFRKIAQDGVRIAPDTAATTRRIGAFGVELALGQHAQRRLSECKAVFQRGHGDGIA